MRERITKQLIRLLDELALISRANMATGIPMGEVAKKLKDDIAKKVKELEVCIDKGIDYVPDRIS